MSETRWQPIETAPKKDGTLILGWDGYMRAVLIWSVGRWELAFPGAYAEVDREYPTHWMPLPAPPEQQP